MEIKDNEFSTLALYAIRYGLGRASYAVKEITDIVSKNMKSLNTGDINTLIRDIRNAESLGMEMDSREWLSLLSNLEIELKRREKKT